MGRPVCFTTTATTIVITIVAVVVVVIAPASITSVSARIVIDAILIVIVITTSAIVVQINTAAFFIASYSNSCNSTCSVPESSPFIVRKSSQRQPARSSLRFVRPTAQHVA